MVTRPDERRVQASCLWRSVQCSNLEIAALLRSEVLRTTLSVKHALYISSQRLFDCTSKILPIPFYQRFFVEVKLTCPSRVLSTVKRNLTQT
jgi:hypothetical protein